MFYLFSFENFAIMAIRTEFHTFVINVLYIFIAIYNGIFQKRIFIILHCGIKNTIYTETYNRMHFSTNIVFITVELKCYFYCKCLDLFNAFFFFILKNKHKVICLTIRNANEIHSIWSIGMRDKNRLRQNNPNSFHIIELIYC